MTVGQPLFLTIMAVLHLGQNPLFFIWVPLTCLHRSHVEIWAIHLFFYPYMDSHTAIKPAFHCSSELYMWNRHEKKRNHQVKGSSFSRLVVTQLEAPHSTHLSKCCTVQQVIMSCGYRLVLRDQRSVCYLSYKVLTKEQTKPYENLSL